MWHGAPQNLETAEQLTMTDLSRPGASSRGLVAAGVRHVEAPEAAARQAIDRSALDRAKETVGITDLWRHLGLPEEPRRSCRSPFRRDLHPSFSIFACGRLWKDHATGDAGDAVSFLKRAAGCSTAEAIARLIDIAGTAPAPAPRHAPAPRELTFPPLMVPRIIDLADLQHLRGWPLFAGLEIAHRRGMFWTCRKIDNGTDRLAWLLTDSARHAAQVRRMDGQRWEKIDAKAWTLAGSDGSWPIGCADIGDRPIVAFCEGGPDLLAVLTLAFLHDRHHRVAAVLMAGASAGISSDALAYFRGKRVRIFEHRDAAGERAGTRWAAQLREAGAAVDGLRLAQPCKDLSDVLAATDAEHLEPPLDIFAGMEDHL